MWERPPGRHDLLGRAPRVWSSACEPAGGQGGGRAGGQADSAPHPGGQGCRPHAPRPGSSPGRCAPTEASDEQAGEARCASAAGPAGQGWLSRKPVQRAPGQASPSVPPPGLALHGPWDERAGPAFRAGWIPGGRQGLDIRAGSAPSRQGGLALSLGRACPAPPCKSTPPDPESRGLSWQLQVNPLETPKRRSSGTREMPGLGAGYGPRGPRCQGPAAQAPLTRQAEPRLVQVAEGGTEIFPGQDARAWAPARLGGRHHLRGPARRRASGARRGSPPAGAERWVRDTEPAPGSRAGAPHPRCPPVCVDTHLPPPRQAACLGQVWGSWGAEAA